MAAITTGQGPTKIRINRFFIFITVLYAVLVLRLVYMQAVNGEFTRRQAWKDRTRVVSVPVHRGDVVDSSGKLLVTNAFVDTLIADPKLIKNPQLTADLIANCLSRKPDEFISALTPLHISVNGKDKYGKAKRIDVIKGDIHVIERMAPEDSVKLAELMGKKQERINFEGIHINRVPERKYFYGTAAGVVLGNSTLRPGEFKNAALGSKLDRQRGRFGTESSFDAELAGMPGSTKAEFDGSGTPIPNTQITSVEKIEGKTIQLTIDIGIQLMVEDELRVMCEKFHPDRATAIVLDPKTGAVLAMASYPPLDPSIFRHMDPNDPGFNNVALDEFEPGSTMKAVTTCGAIDDGAVTAHSHWFCSGSIMSGGKKIKCVLHGKAAQNGGHMDENIFGVIGNSCNVATSEIGRQMGMKRLDQWLSAFHFLQPTGIGLRADKPGTLRYGPTDRNSSSKAARVAFGQAVQVTPLAMAISYMIIANNGKYVAPRLVKAYLGEKGNVIQSFPPDAGTQILKPQTAVLVNQILQGVVTHGTGRGIANVPGYTVAGKTGTAQKVVDGSYNSRKHVASFAGYLPATNPRAVIYVLADSPTGEGWGSEVAGPCFQKIAQKLMVKLNVPMDDVASAQKAIAQK